jgi:GTP diphosphokinase / guanosine-3',5'-bis(diphosphate) 3'-diphosphatase
MSGELMTFHYTKRIHHADDLTLILEALTFASEKHRHQRRKDVQSSPYINHPIAVARTLKVEGGVHDATVICAALLHDTIEDTDTTYEELQTVFGDAIADMVLEVSDDKSLSQADRKRLQIEHAHRISAGAKLVKLADKICNLRDVISAPPAGWSLGKKEEYREWCRSVVDKIRGANADLEAAFDRVYEAALRASSLSQRRSG